MASLSEYKQRWWKKWLLALISNNHANKKTIWRFAIVYFKLIFLETTFQENGSDDKKNNGKFPLSRGDRADNVQTQEEYSVCASSHIP
eukprot:scaffold74078_cov59-Attheya_sp.AAC.3